MISRKLSALLLLSGVMLLGCQPQEVPTEQLTGAWLQEQDGHQQGVLLHPDGRLSLLGIASMQGVEWHFSDADNVLTLATNTERYPQPESEQLTVAGISPSLLQLEGRSLFAGRYAPANDKVTIVSGEVFYRQRIALPENAVLRVTLNDVSLADAPARLIANTTQMITTQVPISFTLAALKSQFEPQRRYSVRATISANNQLLFTSTRHYGVEPTQPNELNIELEAVSAKPAGQAKAAPVVELTGDFRYMADAALFLECGTDRRWPVAANDIRRQLELQYGQLKAGPGEPLLMTVMGAIERRPGMEDGSELDTLVLSKVIAISEQQETCD
ncbi:YbaY family lipoprotein [Neiella sp. HB171785]|uniref:YbaY family lipoprotein n=1 Tax=Neiella litorisoli TaxID=2771431 RepID=A0A8J6QHS7_9GAMM|nr:YbaY family lipoprotein [Neiella litorisoli]MBD1389990.1 YbaY family lipoprotein [Neiella litorisoli]